MKHIEPQKGNSKFDKTFQEHEVIHLCSGTVETVFTIACKYYLVLFKDFENHINIKKSEFIFINFSSVMPVCMVVLKTPSLGQARVRTHNEVNLAHGSPIPNQLS